LPDRVRACMSPRAGGVQFRGVPEPHRSLVAADMDYCRPVRGQTAVSDRLTGSSADSRQNLLARGRPGLLPGQPRRFRELLGSGLSRAGDQRVANRMSVLARNGHCRTAGQRRSSARLRRCCSSRTRSASGFVSGHLPKKATWMQTKGLLDPIRSQLRHLSTREP
jgi:hypothetical protein